MLGLELSLDEAPERTKDVLDQNIHLEPLLGTKECFVHPSFLSNKLILIIKRRWPRLVTEFLI